MIPREQTKAIVAEVAAKHRTTPAVLCSYQLRNQLIGARVELAQRLYRERGLSHQQIAQLIGRERSTVSCMVSGIAGRSHPNAWTLEEDEKLRSMFLTHTRGELSKAIGRTYSSIGRRITTLGLRLPPEVFSQRMAIGRCGGAPPIHENAWTKEEDAQLRTLLFTGHKNTEIGAVLGRSVNAVKNRIRRLKLQRWTFTIPSRRAA